RRRTGHALATGARAVHLRIPGVRRHVRPVPRGRRAGHRDVRPGRDLHPVDVPARHGRARRAGDRVDARPGRARAGGAGSARGGAGRVGLLPAARTGRDRSGGRRDRRPRGRCRSMTPDIDYLAVLPLLVVLGAAIVSVLVEAFVPARARYVTQVALYLGGLGVALVSVLVLAGTRLVTASGAVAVDGPTLFLQGATVIVALGAGPLIGERRRAGPGDASGRV